MQAFTILFLHALAKGANGFDGALLGGFALAALFVAMQWLAFRLPLRPMFVVTSAFLFLMGLRTVGKAFRELQEQQILPYTTDGVPGFVSEWGLNHGTWEVIGTQAALLLLALVAGILPLRRRETEAQIPAASRRSVRARRPGRR